MSTWLPTSTAPPPSMACVAVPIPTPLGAHPWVVPPLFYAAPLALFSAAPPVVAPPVLTTTTATVVPLPAQQPVPLPSAPAASSPITLESLAAAVQDVTRSLAAMQSYLAIWQQQPPPSSTATVAAAPTTSTAVLPGRPSLQHPFTDGIFYRGTGVQQIRMSAAVRLQAAARGLLARRRVWEMRDMQLQLLQVALCCAKDPHLVRCVGNIGLAVAPTTGKHVVFCVNSDLQLCGSSGRGATPFLVTGGRTA